MSGILRLESLTKGNTLKQGDKTPLKYRLFDADGEKLNIAGKTAKVRLVYPDFLTIGYEKDGLTVAQDDTVTFTIDGVIPSRIYHVEIIVDGQFIFPSRADESKFTVDKSSLGTEANIIEIVGKDALIREVKSQVDTELQPLVTSLESAQQAETQRASAESNRVSAEAQRKTDHANRSAELASKADKVVIKNLIKNGDFSDGLTMWTGENGTTSLEDGKLTIATNGKFPVQRIYQNWVNIPINHMGYFYYTLDEITNYSTRLMQMFNASGFYGQTDNIIKLGLNSWVNVNNTSTGQLRYTIAYTQPANNPVAGSEHFTISNAGFIDLTATFGAGNEPTREEMDRLIKVTGYIDGEYALNNKEMLGHLMQGVGEKANKKQEDWITVPVYNGVQHGKSPLKVMKDNMGVVHFKGSLTNLMTGSKAFSVPIGYRPDISVTESVIRIPVSLNTTRGFNAVQINYVGDAYINNPLAEQITYFNGVSYVAERG